MQTKLFIFVWNTMDYLFIVKVVISSLQTVKCKKGLLSLHFMAWNLVYSRCLNSYEYSDLSQLIYQTTVQELL